MSLIPKRNQYLFIIFRDGYRDSIPQPLKSVIVQGLAFSDLCGAARLLMSQQLLYCHDLFVQVYEDVDGHFVFSDVIFYEYELIGNNRNSPPSGEDK